MTNLLVVDAIIAEAIFKNGALKLPFPQVAAAEARHIIIKTG